MRATYEPPPDIFKFWYTKRSLELEQECQQIYSDRAIEALNTLRFVFDLNLRSTEGFAKYHNVGLSYR